MVEPFSHMLLHENEKSQYLLIIIIIKLKGYQFKDPRTVKKKRKTLIKSQTIRVHPLKKKNRQTNKQTIIVYNYTLPMNFFKVNIISAIIHICPWTFALSNNGGMEMKGRKRMYSTG